MESNGMEIMETQAAVAEAQVSEGQLEAVQTEPGAETATGRERMPGTAPQPGPGGPETPPAGEGGEPDPAPEPPPQQPPQDPETNRRFAEQRRRDEVFRQVMEGFSNPVTGKPFGSLREFETWKTEWRQAQEAQAAGLEPARYVELERQIAEKVKQSDPEVLAAQARLAELERKEQQGVFQRDLAAIRKAYPEEKAKSIEELGMDFMAMMATGKVSPLAAYEAVRAERRRTAPPAPSMGDVGGNAGKEKEFYTRDEVQKMSPEEVRRNYEKVRVSMGKW